MEQKSVRISVAQKLTVAGFFISVFIVGLDSFIISALLPTIASSLHSSVTEVGFGVTMYAVFYAVGAPIITPFSERMPRKRMIMVGLLVFTVATFLCGTASNVGLFYAYRSLAGLGAAMFTPNVYSYIGANFSRENIGKVMGIVMSALSLSVAIGVPAGSFIASVATWNWTFFCSAIFAAIAFVLIVVFVQKDERSQSATVTNPLRHYKNILSAPKAMLGLLTTFLWIYGFYAVYTYLGAYAGSTFNLSVSSLGLVFVAYGASNFVSSFSGGWVGNALGMKRAALISGLVVCLTYLLLGWPAAPLPVFVGVLAVLAFAQGIGVPQLTTFNTTVLPESRTTMTSLNSSCMYLGLTIGSALGGVLLQSLSFMAICVSAVISTILAIILTQMNMKA